MDLGQRLLASYVKEINAALDKYFPQGGDDLQKAMNYAFAVGGKRLRPAITLAICEALGGDKSKALPLACALEMMHTSSLIYDDLPCMDDDDMRRGKPSNHKVFGEDVTLLAGLGLNAKAYTAVTDGVKSGLLSHSQGIEAIDILARASGLEGIVPGQALDLKNKDHASVTEAELTEIHRLKTGAMIRASALLGCVAAEASAEMKDAATRFADALGMAFQIRDDILDVTSTPEALGKTPGKDRNGGKTTFADIYGIEKAQELVAQYTEKALAALSEIPNSDFLAYLTRSLCNRDA